MLQKARSFFHERNILEIDCGALVRKAPLDSNIDVIQVDQDNGYLHTSPEYALKRLLASGSGDIYFLGHVFRKGELGSRHNPEFTMAEWYRLGITFQEMIQETADFLALFFGSLPLETISYREAFQKFLGIDYSKASLSELQRLANNSAWDRETCIHYLVSHEIEPRLGATGLTALIYYPPDEAALACVTQYKGEIVAERFEIYYKGVELCNGYHELSDPNELRRRFEKQNLARLSQGKAPYELDEKFLDALQHLPPCCGVALGFDRALMLRHSLPSIRSIIPFAWDEV
jgi:elongation factor P--(R)-beta-lysine ligase